MRQLIEQPPITKAPNTRHTHCVQGDITTNSPNNMVDKLAHTMALMEADFHNVIDLSQKCANMIQFTQERNIKIDPLKTLAIANTQRENTYYTFLETGNVTAGLYHIIIRHGEEFIRRGVRLVDLPGMLMQAAAYPKTAYLYRQGRDSDNPRVVYAVCNPLDDKPIGIALSIGTNGFIVGANVANIDDKHLKKMSCRAKANYASFQSLQQRRNEQVQTSRDHFQKYSLGFRLDASL